METQDLGWWAISGAQLLETLHRAQAGDDADLLYAELYANSHPTTTEGPSRREVAAQLLREHWRTPTSACTCGGVRLGEDWALHVADVLLQAEAL